MVRVITAYVDRHKENLCCFMASDMNRNASALGRLAKGKPKKYSAGEIKRRTALLKKVPGETVEEEALGLGPANSLQGTRRQ
jgi:hypothetical protein